MTERFVTPDFTREEDRCEASLRPRVLAEYIGQSKAKENLQVFIDAARGRQESLDHVLFYGPPGLGKTTLANIVASEMGVSIKSTSGPVIEKPGDLAAILTNLSEGDVLFIDEIHRLSPVVEEILYPAMEDYQLDIIIGQGPSARTIKLDIPRFTLVGATTRAGLLSSPLRDRFGVICRLEFYSMTNLPPLPAAVPDCWTSLSKKRAKLKSLAAAGARHALRIVFCDGCGILLRLRGMVSLPALSPTLLCRVLRLTTAVWITWTDCCYWPSLINLLAVR